MTVKWQRYQTLSLLLSHQMLCSCHLQVLNEDDDVFITGVLRESLGLGSPRFLNPRYTFDITSVEKWLRGSSGLPLPWIFAGGITDVQLMSQLWTKTLQIHDETKF